MKELTQENFQSESANGNTIIDFYGKGCGNCKMMEPFLVALAAENPTIKFFKADIDNNPTAVETYGIMSLPTIVFLKNGIEAEKMTGIKPKTLLQRKITEIFA